MAILDDIEQRLPRRERERLVRRQEIIEAARAVFAERGFNDAKLEDVAERAEFGKGTLYNYFSSKESLFESVLEDSFDTMKKIAHDALTADVPFAEKVDQFVVGELHYFFHNPQSMQLIMREAHHLRDSNPMMQLMPQLLSMLAAQIESEQKRGGVIADAEPMDLATVLINLLYGQFTSRVFRMLCQEAQNPPQAAAATSFCHVINAFSGLSNEEIHREIVTGARIIHQVFFNGVATDNAK